MLVSALFLEWVDDDCVFLRENGIELDGRLNACVESADCPAVWVWVRVRALSDRVASCMGLEWTSRGLKVWSGGGGGMEDWLPVLACLVRGICLELAEDFT